MPKPASLFRFFFVLRGNAAIEAVHRGLRSFRQNHLYGFGALLDFLGDQILFVAADLAEHVLLQIAAHFLGLHAQADTRQIPLCPARRSRT